MAKIESLEALLLDELQDLYNAESQLVKALPKMAEAAHNPDLRAGFEAHLEETKGHVERLEQAFSLLDEEPKGKTCHAMKGLIEEGEESIDLKGPDAVQDASIIGAAQRVEHYEMAAYGTARDFAKVLGKEEIARLLQETLDEEGATDKKLSELAKRINRDASKERGAED